MAGSYAMNLGMGFGFGRVVVWCMGVRCNVLCSAWLGVMGIKIEKEVRCLPESAGMGLTAYKQVPLRNKKKVVIFSFRGGGSCEDDAGGGGASVL